MLEEARGNLLKSEVDALVNTVNTAGVMGKGIALQFKRAFPDNFRSYEAACRRGEVQIGSIFVHETGLMTGPRYILNFPTKVHWRAKSKLGDIELGLADLRRKIIDLGIRSVAVPPLGCGNGGLNWSDVRSLIEQCLSNLPDVNVYVYPPDGTPCASEMAIRTKRPRMTRVRAALLLAFERYSRRSVEAGLSEDGTLSLVEAQKVAYFLQLAGWDSKWDFTQGYFGPYAVNVDQFISSVEGHFMRGYGDGTGGSRAVLELLEEPLREAHEMMDGDIEFEGILEAFEEIVEGFEFPYGIELLSTVHYVATRDEQVADLTSVVRSIESWSRRKRQLFKPSQLKAAYSHLSGADMLRRTVTSY